MSNKAPYIILAIAFLVLIFSGSIFGITNSFSTILFILGIGAFAFSLLKIFSD